MLLHGLGGHQGMWQPLLPALEKRYWVVLLDLVGCGGSDVAAYSSDLLMNFTNGFVRANPTVVR